MSALVVCVIRYLWKSNVSIDFRELEILVWIDSRSINRCHRCMV